MFDKDEVSRRRKLADAKAREAKLREELAAIQKAKRSARSGIDQITRHENWHARTLAAADRRAGYTGEMASARLYLRSLPVDKYSAILAQYAMGSSDADNLSVEVAAVRANFDQWHRKGEAIILDRERRAYAAECARWADREASQPTQSWRAKPMTRGQYFLIARTAEFLNVAEPTGKITRGAAHDWLKTHDANLRLRPDGVEGS